MKKSAGILPYRFKKEDLEVFLCHMGGPYWQNKNERAWTIPKGEYSEEEKAFESAKREFEEETGFKAEGDFIELEEIQQSNQKSIKCWALEKDLDSSKIESNYFEMEWPPNSGEKKKFPEIDRAEWYKIREVGNRIIKGQVKLLKQLCSRLNFTSSVFDG